MGDEEEGRLDLALKLLEKALHLPAELGVERAERLVEEDEPRLADDGAGQRDALLLAAAQLRRVAPAIPLERDELQRLGDAPGDLRLADAADLQAVADIRLDRHVREERVVLEDGVERPPVDRHRRDVDAVERDRRRASAAARPPISRRIVVLPEPLGPSTVMNSPSRRLEVDIVQNRSAAIGLGDLAKLDQRLRRAFHQFDRLPPE